MLSKGPAKRVTVFVNEDTRHGTEPLWRAIFDLLVHKQAAGATVYTSLNGFRESPPCPFTGYGSADGAPPHSYRICRYRGKG